MWISLLLAGLALSGCKMSCEEDKKSSGSGSAKPVADTGEDGEGVAADSVEEKDAGGDVSSGADVFVANEELPSVCDPGKYYCQENILWRCLPENKFEKFLDCGRLVCNPNPGICAQPPDSPYICDTENQFVLNFNRETKAQWQHNKGDYSCEPLCPWDEGHDAQPLLVRDEDSIYFEAPVCANAKQVRIVFEAKLPNSGTNVLLTLPFQQDPYHLQFTRDEDCGSHAFAVADFESNADFESILRNGRLPITLELDVPPYRGSYSISGKGGVDDTCYISGASASFGLSRATVVSCYPDIKTPDGRSISSCELPVCHEVGAFRCYGNALDECTQQGWKRKEVCSGEESCNEEEGKCLEPAPPPETVEVCGEPQEIFFHEGTAQEFEIEGKLACDPLCPQFPNLLHQPLLGFYRDAFVSKSFELPEGLQDPDKVYVDFILKVEPDSVKQVTVGEVAKDVHFPHSCAPIREVFAKEDGVLAENGILNTRINTAGYSSGTIHERNFSEGSCSWDYFATGVVALTMTPCNIEYR